jgi:tetratricopeptide (TPR) repeat protein
MAPGDVGALVGLGWTLSHDTIGRLYTYDWDRAGAIAALRQASKLDPKHLGAAVMLAEVLQHDPSGRLYDGADLAGAADAWRAALAIDKTDEHALALARVLVWSEQFAEAEKVARSAGASEDRDRWTVVAIAGRSGAAAATQAAGELRSGSTRNQLLLFAGWTMMMLQRYDVARELLSGSGTAPRGIEAIVAKLQPHPPLQLRPADPRSVVLEMLAAQLDSLRKTPVFWDAEVDRALRGAPGQGMVAGLRTATARWISDVAQSTVNIEIEGEAGVWRATLKGDGQRYPVYLVLDRGAVKVIGGSSALAGVGRYILRGDARADARARRLLDWLRADVDLPGAEDASSFKPLWGPGLPTSHDAIQLAAAILAGATDPDRVIAVAKRCPSTDPDGELACHQAGFVAYRARRQWAEAVADSEAIDRLRPSWREERTQYHAWVLARAGRFDDADRALDAALAINPNHLGAKIGRLEVAVMRASAGGSAADVIARGDALASDPSAGPWELQYVAWQRLGMVGMPGPVSDLTGALELARKAVDRAPQDAGYLSTLAALEAEHGDLDRAIQDNQKAMELRGASEPTADHWYILGRIDEQLGLTADAVAAYKRVTGTPPDELVTVQALAQRRLAAIGGRP